MFISGIYGITLICRRKTRRAEYPRSAVAGNLQNGEADRDTLSKLIKQGALLIDVRSGEEYEKHHFGESINLPHDELFAGRDELPSCKDLPIIVYCSTLKRSSQARDILSYLGYKNVYTAKTKTPETQE